MVEALKEIEKTSHILPPPWLLSHVVRNPNAPLLGPQCPFYLVDTRDRHICYLETSPIGSKDSARFHVPATLKKDGKGTLRSIFGHHR